MQGIGIGESDFKGLRIRDNYYIDKTMYIKHIIDNSSRVILVTRPRRFGKTLNMSMLKYYFNCTTKDNAELFKGLKIMEQGEKYTSKMGYYPVIYITLKDVRDRNYENMLLNMKTAILDMYQEHMYLLDSDKIYDFEKEKIKDILYCRENEVVLRNSVKDLSRYLNRYYNKPVIMLVDEYDVPLQSAYQNNYYDEMVDFLRSIFSSALKTNDALEKSIMTGCLRISKESIFTGLNNFSSYSVLNNISNEYFGFTEKEVKQMLKDYDLSDSMDEVKEWYDGYMFGNLEIYNPWSTLMYVKNKRYDSCFKATSFRANTSRYLQQKCSTRY